MKILHISDFHFKNERKSKEKQQDIVQKICNQLNGVTVDIIIFSGDLVNKGDDIDDFTRAKEVLITKLSNELSVHNNIFICAGNHDINRNDRSESIIKYIDEEIKSNDDLNKFMLTKDYKDSMLPSNNYYSFVKKMNNFVENDHMKTVYKTVVDGKNISVVSINTAWRAIGLKDDYNLLYPIDELSSGLSSFNENTDFKILILHHQLSDFKRFNSYELTDFFHNKFDIMFSGHVHRESNSINLTATDGIIKMVAPAALSEEYGSEIGFGLIDIDFEESEFSIKNYIYDKKRDFFYEQSIPTQSLPTSEEKRKQNDFRKKLRNKFEIELDYASQLIVSKDNNVSNHSFFQQCTPPVLKSISTSEVTGESAVQPDIDWNTINDSEEDYLILGKDKCGKTILLKKIQLDLLSKYSEYQTIPFYVDFKEWTKTKKEFDIVSEFYRYFQINKNEVKSILYTQKVLFLFDNFHISNVDIINGMIKGHSLQS